MDYINPRQPHRPRLTEEGRLLRFRTRPKKQRKMIRVDLMPNQICQMRLYRAVCADEVPLLVGIGDLHQWIANGDELFSTHHLGYCVINALDYEPRKLMNNAHTNGPVSSYSITDIRELKYGLEWMICIWLRNYLNKISGPGEAEIDTAEQMDEELRMLAEADHEEYLDVYENGLDDFLFPAVDWKADSIARDWEFEETYPQIEDQTPQVKREKPRDLRQAP